MTKPNVSGYRLQRQIARGEQGDVWQATDEEIDSEVALHIAHEPLVASLEEFDAHLFALISATTHPGLVTVHSGGITDEGHPFMVLDAAFPSALPERVTEGGLDVNEALPLMIHLASAVQHLHHVAVIHGAVGLEHLAISSTGETVLAGYSFPGVPPVGRVAPEALRGDAIDERSDVFGLGATMWELVGGRHLPVRLQTLLTAAVVDDPRHRLPTVTEFIEGLQRVERALGLPETPAPKPNVASPSLAGPRGASAHLDAVTQLRVLDPDTVTKVRLRDTWQEDSLNAETRLRVATDPAVRSTVTMPLPVTPLSQERGMHAFDPALGDLAEPLYKPRAAPLPVAPSETTVAPPAQEASGHEGTRLVATSKRNLVTLVVLGALVMCASVIGIFVLVAQVATP